MTSEGMDMAARKKQQTLHLDEEDWGERLRRAFYRGKEIYGYTYDDCAERISKIRPTAQSALVKLYQWKDLPSRLPTRQTAYFALLSYGFDPEDFGLDITNSGMVGYDMKRVCEEVKPRSDLRKQSSECTTVSPAQAA